MKAIDISYYIIDKFYTDKIELTNLKLQRLLYLIQKEHIKKYNWNFWRIKKTHRRK